MKLTINFAFLWIFARLRERIASKYNSSINKTEITACSFNTLLDAKYD